MERARHTAVATFFAPGIWDARVSLSEAAVHHAHVKRMGVGDEVRLSGGDGRRAYGELTALGKHAGIVEIDAAGIESVPAPWPIELCVPVGDRDRMLILAEKSVELGVSAWRPVIFARSRSVTPRGEGEAFKAKVLARQVGALEQSGSAWLPRLHGEVSFASFMQADTTSGSKLLLDGSGNALLSESSSLVAPVTIVLGPEGGLEDAERATLIERGWRPVSLGTNILRFETAAIVAVATLRQMLP